MARAKNEMAPFAVYPGPCASIGVSAAQALMDLPRLNAIVCDLLPDEIEREHPHLWSIVRAKYFFIPSNFASEPSIASQKAHFHHPASASTAETGHFTATLLAEALNETTCSARAETATIHDPVSVLAIEGAQNLAAFLQRSENSRSRAVNLA